MGAIAAPLASPIYSGSGTSSQVPNPYPIGIDGHGFIVDPLHDSEQFRNTYFHHESIPVLKPQQDVAGTFGEGSLDQTGLARFSQYSWHHGAGQTYLDDADSDRFRFRSSKGVNPWTVRQLTLLGGTASRRVSANTNLALLVVGSYLYLVDGNEVYWTQDITVTTPTWTAANINIAEGAHVVNGICSDGYNVYAAIATNGVHTTTRGATVATHVNDTLPTLIGFANGRLLTADGQHLRNITNLGSVTAPTDLAATGNTDFVWVGFAEGPGVIYAAGFSGDKSSIYRVALKADGTALDVPIVAAKLPSGEVVRSIAGYLGFILIGTDKGIRFAQPANTAGDLAIGQLIPMAAAVRCFEGQDRFAWFGWTNYDSNSTGLGRLDLSIDVGGANVPLPAYASDLMAAGQGNVTSVVTFQGLRVLTVSGVGVFAETADLVASGTVDTGLISFGIADKKVAVYVDTRYQALMGSVTAYIAGDGGTFSEIGTDPTAGATADSFPARQITGERFEIREMLTRATTSTVGPTFTRHTLRATIAAATGSQIVLPIILYDTYKLDGAEYSMPTGQTPASMLALLEDMRTSRRVVILQELSTTYPVTIDSIRWIPHHRTPNVDQPSYNGLAIVTATTLT